MDRYSPLLLSALFLFAFTQGAGASDVDRAPLATVEGTIRFGDGATAKFRASGDVPLVVRDNSEGIFYSFRPQRSLTTGDLEIEATETRLRGRVKTSLDLEPQLSVSDGLPQILFRRPSLSIDFTSLELDSARASGEKLSDFINGLCCVTCGDRTICAESVTMSCGSCTAR